MVTVIATGFDGRQRPPTSRHEDAAVSDATTSGFRVTRERDFLEELERQRSAPIEEPLPGTDDRPATATVGVRSVGETPSVRRAPTYDSEDLEIPSFLRRK
jgi:hypothetical protein